MFFPKVLVLGATGRLGAILRKCWPADPVLWQSRRSPAPQDGLNWCVLDPLGQPEALRQAAKGRAVILCLAGVIPGRGGNLQDNVRLAEAAVRAGAETGARVVLISSAAVYGHTGGVLKETTPLAPVSDYGRAKAGMEARAACLGQKLDVPVTMLRVGNVAGADAILGNWQPGFRLDRFADGHSPQRSYIGMATLARVLGDLVAANRLPSVLNVAAPGMLEMAALLDAAGLGWTPQPAGDTAIAQVCLSTHALEQFTTFAPGDSRAATMVAQWRVLEPDNGENGA